MILTGGTLLLAVVFLAVAARAESYPMSASGIRLLEAVKTTLERQPDLHSARQNAELNRGTLVGEKGAFDPVFGISAGHDHTQTPASVSTGLSHTDVKSTSLALTLSKKYRNGVVISPNLTLTRADMPESYPEVQNTAGVNFTVSVPLMRGWGEKAAAAQEMAAEKRYAYSLHQIKHQIQQSVFDTVQKYWEYQAAQKKLAQLKDSESRAETHVEMVRALIRGDEISASELENMLANFESKTVSRIEGEQALYEAKQGLGLAMGIEFEEIEALPFPSDNFPKVDEVQKASFDDKKKLIQFALINREDYLAAGELQKSREILVKAALNGLKPKLDLRFNVGYSGLREGSSSSDYISSMSGNIPGAGASILLTCELPYKNTGARGNVLREKSEYEKSRIEANNLVRNIASDIATAFWGYESSRKTVINAENSSRHYRTALKKEKEKVSLGTGTLLDLITVEERMTNALLAEITSRMEFAVALARCRFETGTMITGHGEQIHLEGDLLTTLPALEETEK